MPTKASSSSLFVTVWCLLMICGAHPLRGQSAETDAVPSQNEPVSSSAAARDTRHHEAGSVEASGPAMKDRLFLRDTVSEGFALSDLSKLAQQKATSDDVKQVAMQVVADRAKIRESLVPVSEAAGVALPTRAAAREQAVYERLSGLSGEAFEQEYLKVMAEAQHKDLREFRTEVASTPDEALRTAAQAGARAIHDTMVMADRAARARGLQPGRPDGRPPVAPPQ